MLVSSDSLSPGSGEEPGTTAGDSRKKDICKSQTCKGWMSAHYITIVGTPTGLLGSCCSSVDASFVSWTVSGDQDLTALVTVKPTI